MNTETRSDALGAPATPTPAAAAAAAGLAACQTQAQDAGDVASSSAAGAAAAATAVAAVAALPGEYAQEEVFLSEDLMKLVFSHLCLEDLCKAGMTRRRWRDITNNPAFWRVIDLDGKTLPVHKVGNGEVCSLLRKHSGVYDLRARAVRFAPGDLPDVLPCLTSLRSLELEKQGAYEERELACLGQLPCLTRLVLAGGALGSHYSPMQQARGSSTGCSFILCLSAVVAKWGTGSHYSPMQQARGAPWPWVSFYHVGQNWPPHHNLGPLPPNGAADLCCLAHPRLQHLVLESGRTGRFAIRAPSLTSLVLRDFMWGYLHLQEASSLAAVSLLDCGKLPDQAVRGLLGSEAPGALPLPALASLRITHAANLSDETLRLLGLRLRFTLSSLWVEGCAAMTGSNLVGHGGGFSALQSMRLEGCDMLSGPNLAASVHSMQGLEALTLPPVALLLPNLAASVHSMQGLEALTLLCCPQVTTLHLAASHLRRLSLKGNRNLQELTVRCPRLVDVDLSPPGPGLAASQALRRVTLASYAVESLQWAGLPALEEVRLQCANLQELDLSECSLLRDSVFDSLGPGAGAPGFADGVQPGCPRLRHLKLSDCEGLRAACLSSPSLESLALSQCKRLARVDLQCPLLRRLGLEECTELAAVAVRTHRMESMSLGTCPLLYSIAIVSPSLDFLDLSISIVSPSLDFLDLWGCNNLRRLRLDCPALRRVDATFCGSLPDDAMHAVARCPALQDLTLAVCNSLTAEGLVTLSALRHLQALDLSYMPLEDPRPVYAACRQLTSLTISNNYLLNPRHLRDLLPRPAPTAAARGGSGSPAAGPVQNAAVLASEGEPGAGLCRGCSPGPLSSLSSLDVSYCEVPSDVLEDLIVRGGQQLSQLTISGCSGVTDELMLRLHRRRQQAQRPATPARQDVCPAVRGSPVPRQHGQRGAHAEEQQAQQGACALRVLSMVGSKALRHVHLGLMPAALAASRGLTLAAPPRAAAPAVPAGQEVAAAAAASRAGKLGVAGREGEQEGRGGEVGEEEGRQEGEALEGKEELLAAVETVLPCLEELRIGLTGVRTVAIGLPSLTRLQLFSCAELRQLTLDCPRLERLSVQACKRLPVDALLSMLRSSCPALLELDVQYYAGVDSGMLPALREACPTLRQVFITAPQRF
ncbi:hypothetical protein N2152v2_002639 [Parachlorella kessleri]